MAKNSKKELEDEEEAEHEAKKEDKDIQKHKWRATN